MAHQLG